MHDERAAAARELPPSTVRSWKIAGVIPARHQPRILEVARQRNLQLAPEHFFPPADPDAAPPDDRDALLAENARLKEQLAQRAA